MPGLFDFEVIRHSGLTWHVMSSGDVTAPKPRWPGLWEQRYPEEAELSPFWRYSVNNQDGEALAVWRAAAWAITEAPLRAAVPRWDRDRVADFLGVARAGIAFIDWEYELDSALSPFAAANQGFKPARSCVPTRPEPDEWERRHAEKAGLFRLRTLSELHRVDAGISFDVDSEMSLFGMPGGDFSGLQRALTGPERPVPADVLGDSGVMAHLTIVRDRFLGRQSYFAIAARRDLSRELSEITGRYEERWQRYTTEVASLHSFQDFVAAMDRLLSPEGGERTSVLSLP